MYVCIVYINLPRHVIVRLSYHQGGDRQREESFLAPSAGKKNCNYDIESSNHHPS